MGAFIAVTICHVNQITSFMTYETVPKFQGWWVPEYGLRPSGDVPPWMHYIVTIILAVQALVGKEVASLLRTFERLIEP